MKRQISGETKYPLIEKQPIESRFFLPPRFFVQLYFVSRSINVEKKKKHSQFQLIIGIELNTRNLFQVNENLR